MEKVTVYVAPYVHCPFLDGGTRLRPDEDRMAYRLLKNGEIEETPVRCLKVRDKVVVDGGHIIPGDGEIIQGCAAVDESASTGQSTPVIREAGGDRSEVLAGTRVVCGRIVVSLNRMSAQS
jgi:K+-transporting ATPase ATPase B chain